MATQLDLTNPRTAHHYMAAMHVLNTVPNFGWYDSYFIAKFEAAKVFLKIVNPDALSIFEGAITALHTRDDFQVQMVDNVLSEERFVELVATLQNTPKSVLKTYEKNDFGRDILHDHPALRTLQNELTDWVSELAGEAVEPSYNFLSLYHSDGFCAPHMDAPSAKWTLDLCLSQSHEWPIYFSDIQPWPSTNEAASSYTPEELKAKGIEFQEYILKPNHALLFSGSSQWHYRNAIPEGGYCHLAFLHYHPAGQKGIIEPKYWADHFHLPELDVLNTVYDHVYPRFAG